LAPNKKIIGKGFDKLRNQEEITSDTKRIEKGVIINFQKT